MLFNFLKGKLVGDGLAARARRGSLLTVAKFGGSNLMRLISNLILTRLLFPEAFGLMALIHVVMSGVNLFSDLGIKASVIQHKRGDDPVFLNTAWTLQILRSLVIYSVIFMLAPHAALFYEEPMLADLMPVAALGIIIQAFMPVRIMHAKRNIMLGRLTVINLGNQVMTLTITVFLVWIYQSVWALVVGTLIGGLVRNVMLRLLMPGIPDRFRLEWAASRDMIGFGLFVFVSTAATFVITSGDRAILGRFISLDLLGVYAIAATLAMVPMQLMRALATAIVFPIYSRQPPHENPESRRKLFKARFLLTGTVFAGSLMLLIFGNTLVSLMYDPRYYTAGVITILLVLGLLPVLIVTSYDPILLSNNRPDMHAVLMVSNGLLRMGALYIGVTEFGILGAALAPTASSLLHYPIMVALTRRYHAWDPRHDVFFALIALGFYGLAWWLHADLITALAQN